MRRLVMIAAGGLAREVIAVANRLPGTEVAALLDDDVASWGIQVGGILVSGPIEEVVEHPHEEILICAGRGSTRRTIAERLADQGVGQERYGTIVDPSVTVPENCQVGAGSILLANVVLTSDVVVGRHVVAMPNVTLTHDDQVGDFATLCAGVVLGGTVRIGEAAYLGMGASVRENVTIGSNAVLGMGATLLTDLPAGQTWVGVPAQPISRQAR